MPVAYSCIGRSWDSICLRLDPTSSFTVCSSAVLSFADKETAEDNSSNDAASDLAPSLDHVCTQLSTSVGLTVFSSR